MCVFICIYESIGQCVLVHKCVSVCLSVHAYLYEYMCVSVFLYMCVCVDIYMCVCVYSYVCGSLYLSVRFYVCVYVC